jgi:hypothetical protein
VIPIDHYGVLPPRFAFSLCTFSKGISPFVLLQKKGERVKLPTWVRVHPDHLVCETMKKAFFFWSFPAGARKPQRVETK